MTSEKKRHLTSLVFVPSVFGEKFPTAEFERYRQKLIAGKYEENSQMFNEDFYLPLYLPLWYRRTYYINTTVQRQERSMKEERGGHCR